MLETKIEKFHRYIKPMGVEIALHEFSQNNMSRSHVHNGYEVYFQIKGGRKLLIENEFYRVEKGDILMIAPGVLHKTLDDSPSGYKRIVYNFPRKILDSVIGEKDIYNSFIQKDAIIVRNPDAAKVISGAIEDLETITMGEDEDLGQFELISLSVLFRLICFLVSNKNILPDTKVSEKKSGHLSEVLEYINEHYTESITLTELSAKFYMSEFYLCRSFKKTTGRTIVEYINYLRIEKAKQLLTKHGNTIKATAKLCGFKTTSHFNYIFKEYEKMNPSQFKDLRK